MQNQFRLPAHLGHIDLLRQLLACTSMHDRYGFPASPLQEAPILHERASAARLELLCSHTPDHVTNWEGTAGPLHRLRPYFGNACAGRCIHLHSARKH